MDQENMRSKSIHCLIFILKIHMNDFSNLILIRLYFTFFSEEALNFFRREVVWQALWNGCGDTRNQIISVEN
jgi:hypothetical protein